MRPPFSLHDYPAARAALQQALERSWGVMSRTVFALRHVFHEGCMFPDTLRKAFMMLVEIHDLAEWEPAARDALKLDAAKLTEIPREKDSALADVQALAASIERTVAAMPEPGISQLRDTFDLWVWYVRGFRACARACFTVRFALDQSDAGQRQVAEQEVADLDAYRQALRRRLDGTRYAYLVYWLLDTARLESLVRDLRQQLEAAGQD